MSAGMLLFVHTDAVATMRGFIAQLNGTSRVSPEVLSLHLVKPTRDAVRDASLHLRDVPELQHLEHIKRLRPNNAVRDLTAPWRMSPAFTNTYQLVVNLETVNPEFRAKYPDPNLTLPAGGVEDGETPRLAAHREMFEETRIKIDPVLVQTPPIGLFRGGIRMYPVHAHTYTPMCMRGDTLYIGDIQRIDTFYDRLVLANHKPPQHLPLTNHFENGGTSGHEAVSG